MAACINPEIWKAVKRKRALIYFIIKTISQFYFFWVLNVNVRGLDFIPEKGPAIIVANHPSTLDGFLMVAFIKRRLHTYAKANVFNSKFKMLFLRSVGGIPVGGEETNENALLEAERLLKNNKLLLIFPEGRINADPDLLTFKSGFLRLAVKCDAPVIPVSILGSHKALSIGQYFPRPYKIYIRILRPLSFNISKERTGNLFNKKEMKYHLGEARNTIQQKINSLRINYDVN